eukprot:15365331-Ditylum_brightwellii.AAC.1
MVTLKKRENKVLQDYTHRFKTTKDVLESHIGGGLQLPKYATTLVDSTTTKEQSLQKAPGHLFAFMYLKNADQAKYGSVLMNLNQQKLLSNNQYTKTVTELMNVLSNYRFDNYKLNSRQNRKPKKEGKEDKEKKKEEDQATPLTFAQMEGRCYCCGKKGHRSPDCPMKDKISQDQWAMRKAQFAQKKEQATPATSKGTLGWAGVHVCFAQGNNLKDFVLLDSDSTDTSFCNKDYITNIHEYNSEPLLMSTNAGVLVTTKKCE